MALRPSPTRARRVCSWTAIPESVALPARFFCGAVTKELAGCLPAWTRFSRIAQVKATIIFAGILRAYAGKFRTDVRRKVARESWERGTRNSQPGTRLPRSRCRKKRGKLAASWDAKFGKTRSGLGSPAKQVGKVASAESCICKKKSLLLKRVSSGPNFPNFPAPTHTSRKSSRVSPPDLLPVFPTCRSRRDPPRPSGAPRHAHSLIGICCGMGLTTQRSESSIG